jgi:hypothetical protein
MFSEWVVMGETSGVLQRWECSAKSTRAAHLCTRESGLRVERVHVWNVTMLSYERDKGVMDGGSIKSHASTHVTCAHPVAPADLFARVDVMARGWHIPSHRRFALCASDEQRTAHHTTSPTTPSRGCMHSRIACVIRRASVGIVIRLGSGPVYVLSMLPASPCADTRPTPAAIAATAATPVQRTAHRCVPGTPMFRSGA